MDERDRRLLARRHIIARQIMRQIKQLPPAQAACFLNKIGIMQAAAGHGRSSNSGNGQQSTGQSGGNSQNTGSSGGGSINYNSSSSGLGGGLGGAAGGGNGRDGRSNYGPNSPPTGSLPPFYESLKGGQQGMNAYNAQNGGGNYGNYLLNTTLAQMECDAVNDITSIGGYPGSPPDSSTQKQYQVLQNAYLQNGIILKDEIDLDYDGKMDSLSLSGNLYDSYSDAMMVDMGGSVDPLQLTATLTFSSPNDHALLESLTDAVDLSQFLQRLPSDEESGCNELELSSTPSLTPDSGQGHCLDNFRDHLIIGGMNNYNDRLVSYNRFLKNFKLKSFQFEFLGTIIINHLHQAPPATRIHPRRATASTTTIICITLCCNSNISTINKVLRLSRCLV